MAGFSIVMVFHLERTSDKDISIPLGQHLLIFATYLCHSMPEAVVGLRSPTEVDSDARGTMSGLARADRAFARKGCY